MAATVDERLAQAFVELADTLVAGYDLMEFLQTLADRCVELLEVEAAGLLLADSRGVLRLVAASTEQARVVELFQIQNDEGPCLDCFRTGRPVTAADLAGLPPQVTRPDVSAEAPCAKLHNRFRRNPHKRKVVRLTASLSGCRLRSCWWQNAATRTLCPR
jgi:GAF domain-containing protein